MFYSYKMKPRAFLGQISRFFKFMKIALLPTWAATEESHNCELGQGRFNTYNAELFLFKPWRLKGFSLWKHHKCLCQLFPLHLYTYVVGLRPLYLCLPSIEVDIYCITSHRSFVRHISFVSVRSLRLSCRRSNTRRWLNAGLLLAHRPRLWANISPVLGYCVMFDATLNVNQRHRRRANINPTLASSSSYCTARARPISIGLKV